MVAFALWALVAISDRFAETVAVVCACNTVPAMSSRLNTKELFHRLVKHSVIRWAILKEIDSGGNSSFNEGRVAPQHRELARQRAHPHSA